MAGKDGRIGWREGRDSFGTKGFFKIEYPGHLIAFFRLNFHIFQHLKNATLTFQLFVLTPPPPTKTHLERIGFL